MPATHTPPQPSRDEFEGDELAAYERVVARQMAYDYDAFTRRVPEEHRAVVAAAITNAPGDDVDDDDRLQPYMGSMLNSPLLMDHLSELGVVHRTRGETGTSYAHADREWIDMVLGQELGCWGVFYVHAWDAVAVGVRTEALRALREGRDEDLTTEELVKAKYIRQVVQGTVTPQSYRKIEELFGTRGAVEYTAFVGHLLMTIRLIQAFGAQEGFTPKMVDDLIGRFEQGTVELPQPKDRIPALQPG